MSGTPFRQGVVILVPFPFSDLSAAKQRPAMIVSIDAHNSSSDDVVIYGITSNLKNEPYVVSLEQKDMAQGDIHFKSKIKVDKLFTVNKSIIKRRLGQVKEAILVDVRKELGKLVGL